jgi:pilus assembly protein FimV
MPVKTRSSIVSSALKTLGGAVACTVLLASAADAAGLGKLTVLSALGQPLRAEVELTSVSAEEAGALTAKLAPAEAFRLANIEFNPTLLSLRFAVEPRNGSQVLRITSSQPVNEPFIDMLLELSWNSGRLVREYTFLLDPADMRQTRPAQVAAPTEFMVGSRGQLPTQSQPLPEPRPSQVTDTGDAPPPAREARPQAQSQPQPQPRNVPSQAQPSSQPVPAHTGQLAAADYRVKPGDNLSRIASQVKPVDVSLDAMLVALYRANPEAFAGHNMNRLKSGQILAVPDADTVRGTSDAEARGVVVAHAADFAAYRNKLAGQVAESAPAKAADTSQSAAGKITAKVEEHATPANESKDQLKLSKAAPATATAGKTAVASVEDKIAKQQQGAEAEARVKELEKNVSDLEKLMAVKKAAADQKKADVAAAPAAPAVPAPALAPVPGQPVADAAAPKPKPKPLVKKAPLPPPPAPTFFDTLSDNMSSIGIALAAILAGVAALVISRRRKKEFPVAETSLLGDPGTQAHSLFAETGGQSVDTNNSVFNSNFSPSASQLDTNEVDPVAEADVYIAYGRDAQAEEILKEALRNHPERHAVALKLLEIYAARKDARAFETQASELYSQTRGQGDDWQQAAALGLSIDPHNPLYAGGEAKAPEHASAAGFGLAAAATVAGAAALTDLELDLHRPHEGDAAAGNGLDFAHDGGLDMTHNAAENMDNSAGEAGRDVANETALPTPASVASDNDADHFLDFDLGGFESVSTGEPIAMPGAAPAVPGAEADEPLSDLDFHLPAADTVLTPPAAKAEPEPEPFDNSMDFGLDLPADLGGDPVAPHDGLAPGETIHLEPVADLTPPAAELAPDPLLDLDAMNFDLPETPAAKAPLVAPAAAVDSGLELEDFLAEQEAVTPAATATASADGIRVAPEFDLSGIDLDLDASAGLPSPASPAPGGNDDALSAIHMEMDTKLDLAVAYQEIGDKEGARELIDEVIKGGSDEQVAKANSMRALLG